MKEIRNKSSELVEKMHILFKIVRTSMDFDNVVFFISISVSEQKINPANTWKSLINMSTASHPSTQLDWD